VKPYDFVSVGNYTKDTIVSAAGTRQVDGGGYSYSAFAAVLAVARVGAITRLAAQDVRTVEPLRALGVDVFVHESAHSTLMRLEYPTANVDERVLSVTAVADSFSVEHVRAVESRAFLVSASVRGEVPLDVVRHLRQRDALLAVDVQGFVRTVAPDGRLRYEAWPEMRAVLELVDILKTDAVEAEFLTGEKDIERAAKALRAHGPREIVLTHKDGLLVLAHDTFHAAAFHPDQLRGRSGRGDTCVGSYTARRLSAEPADATRWAAAVTSLKLEAEGPVRRSRADVENLLRLRYA
jgi:sugar/nucleoside kinase (ribokinase family)